MSAELICWHRRLSACNWVKVLILVVLELSVSGNEIIMMKTMLLLMRMVLMLLVVLIVITRLFA